MTGRGQDLPARVATLRDVALRAGVDVSTASRALSGRRRVSPAVAARVQSAASALGYSPNGPARNLRMARTMTLGLVSPRFSNPALYDFIDGLSSIVEAHDYSLMLTFARGDAEHYRKLVRRLFERRVDGLFAATPPDLDSAYTPYAGAGVPVMSVFARGQGPSDTPLLTATEEAALDASVRRLVALGHRRAFYIGTPSSIPSVRLTWLAQAIERAGMGLRAEAVTSVIDDPVFRVHLPAYLRGPDAVSVIYVHSEFLPQTMHVLNSLHLRVPQDVSVVAFGQSPWTMELGMKAACILLDMRVLGEAAGSAMIAWLSGERPSAEIVAAAAAWVEHPTVGPAPGPARSEGRSGAAAASLP